MPGGVSGVGYGWRGNQQRGTLDSGLMLLGRRLYNPAVGAFTSTDPIVDGNTTPYTYPQDPINNEDLSGLQMRPNFPRIQNRIASGYDARKIAEDIWNHPWKYEFGVAALPHWSNWAKSHIRTMYYIYEVKFTSNFGRGSTWKYGITSGGNPADRWSAGVRECKRWGNRNCRGQIVARVGGFYTARWVEMSLIDEWSLKYTGGLLCPPGHNGLPGSCR